MRLRFAAQAHIQMCWREQNSGLNSSTVFKTILAVKMSKLFVKLRVLKLKCIVQLAPGCSLSRTSTQFSPSILPWRRSWLISYNKSVGVVLENDRRKKCLRLAQSKRDDRNVVWKCLVLICHIFLITLRSLQRMKYWSHISPCVLFSLSSVLRSFKRHSLSLI